KYKVDIIGISVRSFTSREALRIKELYLKKYPDAKVKSISGFLDVQCCYPFLDMEEKISYETPFSDEYPFPEYELFDSFNYLQTNWETGFWGYAIMTSQGCPYQCVFCASRNRKWKARSAENCFEELKRAKGKYKIKKFEIIDDVFNVDKNRVLRFCELIRPLNLKWACVNGIRADRFDKEMAVAMSDSGCVHVGFGIESSDPEVLVAIQKGETIEKIEKAVDIAKKHIEHVTGFFIIGLPASSYEKDLKSIEWIKGKQIDAIFSYCVPEPGRIKDNVFYGTHASPASVSYDTQQQKNVYLMSKKLKRSEYIRRNIIGDALLKTVKSIPKYNLNSWMTHSFNVITRLYGVITKGEIQ
ncbi:MAG: radical SAM protein, partial [Elusimicrobiota bacterium]